MITAYLREPRYFDGWIRRIDGALVARVFEPRLCRLYDETFTTAGTDPEEVAEVVSNLQEQADVTGD